ncbi:E3 ubiquitin-protein ligase Mdm2-like [Ischnura elegans]|uniref:E3 ubiquitin-protein ligase Mdm2-like n=1 Tax=Ischnura elegans TaxID=197161 RepID=UPI001ED87FAB|nr:E3 ubiquitin-protein ligase Mdm2-like [Ischnura elegans]XP_046398525.1 E3 ubiquitin-protein ligase Mdm2-like [Ischnura elegans]
MQKRERENDSIDFLVHPSKRQNLGVFFVPEMSPVLSGDESVHSMQGWETELCRDTPDTSSHSEDSSQESFSSSDVEYELGSLSEAERPFRMGSVDTSSDDEECCVKVTEIVLKVEDEEFWGDDSHSDTHSTSTDQEIPSTDLWTCLRCKAVNKPLPRYCKRCFQVRKNWFPPRPRCRSKKRKVRKKGRNVSKEFSDSGLGSFSKKDDDETRDISAPTTSTFCDTAKPNTENAKDVVSAPNSDKCVMCMEGTKNAAFVHGNVGHICCCYKCAKTAWSISGKCPVCNRKSNRIIKVFFA